MPSYLGVSQADLIRSINDGLELLEKHSPGPECQKYIDDLRVPSASGQSKLDAIATASDDIGLAAMVRASGVKSLFNLAYDVFEFHARANTDGKGYAVLKGLLSTGIDNRVWGDFLDRAQTVREYPKVDQEFDSFLKRHFIQNAFNNVRSALKIRDVRKLYTLSPMRYYRLEPKDIAPQKTDNPEQAFERAIRILHPFREFDEVRSISRTGGSLEWAESSVDFASTLRAAQAAANALPGMNVIRSVDNKVIPPQEKPHPPRSQPNP